MTDRIRVGGLDFDLLTETQVIEHVVDAISRGSGGTIVTPNIDICRRTDRDPSTRGLVDSASIVVPDGIPLLWAARLAGLPLVQRIAGADLIFSLSAAAAANSWPIYVLGGLPGEDGGAGAAELAAGRLAARYEGLKIAGAYSPPFPFDAKAGNVDDIRESLVRAKPKIVFVGLGFPKQERLIARISSDLPDAWFVGCGAAIPIAAGQLKRAHPTIQRLGLEWLHRLVNEPRRLAKRYLVHDLPYAIWLLCNSALHRNEPARQDSSRNPAETGLTSPVGREG
ncbi:MAG TPA: WecB/TagA/CpsF family glycosyltransferase [Streptosporangiaceae bacterium]|nr:WecB/TagA/CpsF family glycosyltransferase [Streptosporangiaceae bacterium]